ncbi:response regulator [Myxococcota bacterium]|nr:response regulator [Myxococcota bacterium]
MKASALLRGAPTVLVVDDEPAIRSLLKTSLRAQGWRTIEAATGRDALSLARQHVPDVVILDLVLPDFDGLDVARELRTWSPVHVLVLSAHTDESRKIAALDAGADDYVTKPFSLGELLARVRVGVRRSTLTRRPDATFASGELSVDLVARRVRVGHDDVHLTPIEYKLLATLVGQAGAVVTHQQLLESIWGPNSVGRTHYLRVHLTHLRQKLDRADPSRFIKTASGVGYRLELPEHRETER